MDTEKPPPYSPPEGPPPSRSNEDLEPPPPYPAPPPLSYEFSSGANASTSDSEIAAAWCGRYRLWQAQPITAEQLQIMRTGNHKLTEPQDFAGRVSLLDPVSRIWQVRTSATCRDTLIQTAIPVYSAANDSPLLTEQPKTIYFEVRIVGLGEASTTHSKHRLGGIGSGGGGGGVGVFGRHARPAETECGIAIGYFAPPYPPFRLPGWQRGSIGVHSDDGRRYVANDRGGLDFTQPFFPGETVGLGMTFRLPTTVSASDQRGLKLDVQVFFTRNGRMAGGWDLHEEKDVEEEGVQGLEGECDIFPAIGVFGPVEAEVKFREEQWLFKPQI